MIGGMTDQMLPHLSGVLHRHVNRPLEREKAKKGPEKSANFAKIAKVTRSFRAI